MNWYKVLLAQNYDDIEQDQYESRGTFEANQYFAIGHNDEYGEDYEDGDGNFAVWIWEGPGRMVKNDKGTHGLLPGGHQRADKAYKGRVDFRQKIISVSPPRKRDQANIRFDISDLPNSLLKDLQRHFPDAYERVIVF